MNHTGVTSVGCDRQAFRKRLSSGVWGNRRLARLGWSDQDRVLFDLDPIGSDRKRRWTAQHLARVERKDALVPRTGDGAARRIYGSFRQAGARVGRRAVAWADPAPPNVSGMSHRDICTHVKVGVSRSV